ncbi:MAG: leucine-rich repeat domain-containing protein, partial [Clostridia bacterium]|nr:leucine-rich repeat domain-containing protein [Clostridia bacterium]
AYGEWLTVTPATCEDGGLEQHVCDSCGKTETRGVSAKGHGYTSWVETTPAGCESVGEKQRICTSCGDVQISQITPIGHSYSGWKITTLATCVTAGEQQNSCVGCGNVKKEAIPATGHSWGKWSNTSEPKCEELGEKQRSCSTCKSVEKMPVPALGHSFNSQNVCTVCEAANPNAFMFEENETGYTFVGIDTFSGTEITIPSTYNGKPVTAVKEYAFNGNTTITSVSVPQSVSYIGKYAFCDCSKLETIVLPDKLECDIGDKTFYNCYNLTSVTIPNGVTSIGDYAFYWCSGLTSVTIPDSVTSIGDQAFYNCYNLTSVTIPDSVTSIGYEAFRFCRRLTSVVFGENSKIESVGVAAFSYCDSLIYNVKGGVNYLGSKNNKYLVAIEGTSKALSKIKIEEGCKVIAASCFSGFDATAEFVIPDSVTSIDNFAFDGCSSLTSVYYEGTASDWLGISIDFYNGDLTSATRYYYSETQPTSSGNWWHYVNGVPTAW